MAIRDRIRRALRKTESSDSLSQTGSNTTTSASNSTSATTTSETSSLRKTTTAASTLSRVFHLGSREKDHSSQSSQEKAARRERRRAARPGKKPVHPSQRPLTLQNLKHQEMLSHFTMTFGATDPNQIESLSFCGVSPCCTRAGSLDLDREDLGGMESLSLQDSNVAPDFAIRP